MNRHILIVGTCDVLLKTWQLIFERARLRIFTARTLPLVEHILDSESIDLCLLCSSLAPEQIETTLALVKASHQHVDCLVRSAAFAPRGTASRDHIVQCLAGPEALLSRVQATVAGAHLQYYQLH